MTARDFRHRMKARIFGYGQPVNFNPYYHYAMFPDWTESLIVATQRVYLTPLIPRFTLTADRIVAPNGTISAGNRYAAIYGPQTYAINAIPDTLPRLVASASGAKAGISIKDEITIANTQLLAGRIYWLAYESDENTTMIRAPRAGNCLGGLNTRSFDMGAYLAPTDPCPATVTRSPPAIYIRVASVP